MRTQLEPSMQVRALATPLRNRSHLSLCSMPIMQNLLPRLSMPAGAYESPFQLYESRGGVGGAGGGFEQTVNKSCMRDGASPTDGARVLIRWQPRQGTLHARLAIAHPYEEASESDHGVSPWWLTARRRHLPRRSPGKHRSSSRSKRHTDTRDDSEQ